MASPRSVSESENISVSTSFVVSTSDVVLEDESPSNPEADTGLGASSLGAASAVPLHAVSDLEAAQ